MQRQLIGILSQYWHKHSLTHTHSFKWHMFCWSRQIDTDTAAVSTVNRQCFRSHRRIDLGINVSNAFQWTEHNFCRERNMKENKMKMVYIYMVRKPTAKRFILCDTSVLLSNLWIFCRWNHCNVMASLERWEYNCVGAKCCEASSLKRNLCSIHRVHGNGRNKPFDFYLGTWIRAAQLNCGI